MKHLFTSLLLVLAAPLSAQTYSLSPVFGDLGAVRVDVVPGADDAFAHHLQPDGYLLLGGSGYDIGVNSFHVSLLRIDTICGAPDPAFGNAGAIAHTHQQRTICTDIAVQPDGRIVGVGMIAPSNAGSQQKAGIFRFMPDGAVDSSFNGLGYHQALWDPVSSGSLWRAFINADSTITCVGESRGNINGGTYAIGAMRFTYDGQFDPDFDGDGINTMPVSAVNGSGAMRPDGRVLAVGATFVNPDYHIVMAQFNADGSPDTTFGVGGWIVTPVIIAGGIAGGMGVSLLPDGRIIVSCRAPGGPEGFLMARFLADGTVDSTYATNGVGTVILPGSSAGADHELRPDGSTLQFGWRDGHATVLAREANGDTLGTFGVGGFADAVTGLGGEGFQGGFTLPSGRIIGYGGNGQSMLAIRLTTDPVADALPVISADGVDLITTGTGAMQWYLDSVLMPGATSNTITPSQNGSYTVVMTLSPECVFTSPPFEMLNVGVTTRSPGDLHILENPVSGTLRVVNKGPRREHEVIDTGGRRILSGTLITGLNEIDLSGVSGGVHLLRVIGGDGTTVHRFMVD